jgi:hypothetical protein
VIHIRVNPRAGTAAFALCSAAVRTTDVNASAVIHLPRAAMLAFGVCPACVNRFRYPKKIVPAEWVKSRE